MTWAWLNRTPAAQAGDARPLAGGCAVPAAHTGLRVDDRGFLLGDGLFETMRLVAGEVPLWPRHRARLLQGLDLLGMPRFDLDLPAIAGGLATLNGLGDGVVRLTVSRGPGRRGYAPAEDPEPTVLVQLSPLQPLAEPWTLGLAAIPVVAAAPWNRIKHTSALPRILLARTAAAQGVQELLQRNTDGMLVEAVACNLFWVKDGTLYTPSLDCGCLPGVARALLVEAHAVREGAFPLDALLDAGEVFLTNAVHGVIPVAELRSVRRWPAPGPVSRRLQTWWRTTLGISRSD